MPSERRRRTRWLQRTPCFMGKPCLSFPPVMLQNHHHDEKTIPEDVTLEFFAETITFDFLGDSLIHENTAMQLDKAMKYLQLVFIIDIEGLLRTESRIANVKLQRELVNVERKRQNNYGILYKNIPSYYSIINKPQ